MISSHEEDNFRFVRCVCAGTSVEEFPIQRVGSGFTFMASNTVFLVTARHVIDNSKCNPMGIILPPLDNSTKWWPVDACVHLEASSEFRNDDSFADLAIYTMHAPPSLRHLLNENDFVSFSESICLVEGSELLAFGYPHKSGEFDAEKKYITGERVEIPGTYHGSTAYRGLGIFHSPFLAEINPDGMSGGPVMVCNSNGHYIFAGMIVQGSSSSQKLHFVTAEWIVKALKYSIQSLLETRTDFHGDLIDTES